MCPVKENKQKNYRQHSAIYKYHNTDYPASFWISGHRQVIFDIGYKRNTRYGSICLETSWIRCRYRWFGFYIRCTSTRYDSHSIVLRERICHPLRGIADLYVQQSKCVMKVCSFTSGMLHTLKTVILTNQSKKNDKYRDKINHIMTNQKLKWINCL